MRNTRRFYDRPVPGSDVEIMSFAVQVTTDAAGGDPQSPLPLAGEVGSRTDRGEGRPQPIRDTVTGEVSDWAVYDRASLPRGSRVGGPA